MQQAATIARHITGQLDRNDPAGLWGIGRRAGVRALDACRHVAEARPLHVLDPDKPAPSRLWETLARQVEPCFSAKALELLPWRYVVAPLSAVTLQMGDEESPFPPGGFVEAIRAEAGGARSYLLGIEKIVRAS